MSDEFEITIPVVRGEGVGVPIGEIQRAINVICQQMQTDLNLIASGGFPLTDVDITGGTITGVAISNSTAVEQGFLDNSSLIATDSFVKRSVLASTATIPISNVTGGIYNFAPTGTGAQIVVLVSGGAITGSLSIAAGGTGYLVGDCLLMVGGNGDAIMRVTAVSGGVITTVSVVYGGTGYTTGLQLTGTSLPPGNRTGAITGTLTSNMTVIIPAGTYLQGGRRIGFQNNTTGAFTVSVFLSDGADGTVGTGTVLPQGSANSTSTLLYTDGQNDVWPEVTLLGLGAGTMATQNANNVAITGGTESGVAITGDTINSTPVGATTPSTGAFTTLTATTPVGVASGGTGRATLLAHGVLVGEGTAGINQLAVGNTGQMLLGSTGADPGFGNNPIITGGTIDGAAIGGTTPATGAFTTLSATGNLTPSQTNGIVGTTTNNNANAGSVGEYVTNSSTGTSLTSNTAANATSVSLTAGDWEVSGVVTYVPAGSTTTSVEQVGISTTSATFGAANTGSFVLLQIVPAAAGAGESIASPPQRVAIASTTTVFLVALAQFAVSTMTCNGFIRARRVR
jgi:hypothetical protein